MKVAIIQIGNSRGIRLPKSVIDQCGLGDTAELHVEQNRIVITPNKVPRQGWADAFRKAEGKRKPEPMEEFGPNQFDHEEWQW